MTNDLVKRLQKTYEVYARTGRDRHAAMWAKECAELIAKLEAEHEEKDERIEELQQACEVVSSEFEGELWQACRYLLGKTHFDFSEANVDGIQADDFQNHMNETLAEFDRAMARIEELEAKLAKAVDGLERIAHASDVYGVEANAEDQGADTLAYAHKSTGNLARTTLAALKGTD